MTTPNKAPGMALYCIDKITRFEKGKGITARKAVTPDEEYFRDHFTGFPVLPGVLILEGLVQSAGWYVRSSEGFRNSQISMVRCSQAKYNRLVKPPTTVVFEVELVGQEGPHYEFKGRASENGGTVAVAKFTLKSAGLGGGPEALFAHLEGPLNEKNRRIFRGLWGDPEQK